MRTLFCRFNVIPSENHSIDSSFDEISNECWNWVKNASKKNNLGKILPEFLEEGNFEGKDSAVRIKLLDTEKGQLLKIRFHTISKYGANEKYKWINHIFL